MNLDKIVTVIETLQRCEEYFVDRQDAEIENGNAVVNEEMALGIACHEALAALGNFPSPSFAPTDAMLLRERAMSADNVEVK